METSIQRVADGMGCKEVELGASTTFSTSLAGKDKREEKKRKTRWILDCRRGILSRHKSLKLVCGPTERSQGEAAAANTETPRQSLALDITVTSQLVSPSPGYLGPNLKVHSILCFNCVTAPGSPSIRHSHVAQI